MRFTGAYLRSVLYNLAQMRYKKQAKKKTPLALWFRKQRLCHNLETHVCLMFDLDVLKSVFSHLEAVI